MAIYHFSAQVISRSQGRSSVAASAYRAAEELYDERLGKTYNFSKKSDVLEKEIMAPEGAPDWLQDRATLWNAVEQKESRKDAQLAREINISLPKELSNEQNWELVKDFVKHEFVSKGMVADLTFHAGHSELERQPHAHVMLTMRELTQEGFGQKIRSWNDRELLKSWREHWADRCNLELARHGLDIQIDHRSLDAQAINLEPQSKIGPRAAHSDMARFVEHQELANRNGERIKADPEIALDAITKQQSTFTIQDLARFINRHTDSEAQFTEVFELVKASAEIVHLGKDDANRERYTTQSMLALERGMLENAKVLSNNNSHSIGQNTKLLVLTGKSLSTEQGQGFLHITGRERMSCIVGFAGTGKSYLLGAAKEAWELEGFKVSGATLSGIAAQNLEAGSQIKSHTIANRLWHWERGKELLTEKDVLVIDEAGMLGSRQMAAILENAAKAQAKVVLVGDPEQLQAIEAGAPFRAIAENLGYGSLTDIRRQIEDWQKEATKDFANSRTKEGLLKYEEHDNIHIFETKAQAIKELVEAWDENKSQSPEKSQIMLAYTKDEVKKLNDYARLLCRKNGELGEDFGVKTSRGIRDFAVGDRVYFLRNENHNLHVKNGTLGTITEVDGRNFGVKLDAANAKGIDTVIFDLHDYRDIEHGYAATIHKAQGITVDRAHVLASQYFDRHTTYVAMSRHKDGADLYYSRDEFTSFNALSKTLGREKSKDVTLDYTQARNVEGSTQDQNVAIKYSAVLNEERAHQAEQRLAWRNSKNINCNSVEEISQITKLNLTTQLHAGDTGVYMGSAHVGKELYRVISLEEGKGFLVADKHFGIGYRKDTIVVDKMLDEQGREYLRATNPEKQAEHDHKQQQIEQARQEKESARLQQEQEQLQRQLQRGLDRGGMEM